VLTVEQMQDLAAFLKADLAVDSPIEKIKNSIIVWARADLQYRCELGLTNNYKGWGDK
jgi:hypothetical protein